MRFSESFLRSLKDRASIAEYAGRFVQWDRRKSQPARGDYWAPCPFHGEKTPSFHVRDPQGSFKCFGCGESGGVLDLAMKLEGLSFPEAVERVASVAGLPLPAPESAVEDGADRRRKRLLLAMEQAHAEFVQALDSDRGAPARSYLEGRGLDAKMRAHFGLGYAPGGYDWAIERLRAHGFALDELIEAGLVYGADQRRPVDVFRNRVMFPIADAQGRIIAFGARALDQDAKAKYLNSPETPLFHKGRTLYRLAPARALLAKTKAKGLVVGEGYMDVIAFERAGIAAVAPLGTALTEDQLALVWRVGPEPIFCFDGDEAGVRASARAIELALPQLGPEKSFRVAVLPAGQDPDDIWRLRGAPGLAEIIAQSRPAIEALFERERSRAPLTTPEQKASLRKRLRDASARITDPETARFYREELLAKADLILDQTRARRAVRKGQSWAAPIAPTSELKPLAAPGQRRLSAEQLVREAIDTPSLIEAHAELFAALPLSDPVLQVIQNACLELFIRRGPVDRSSLSRHLADMGEVRAVARLSYWPKAQPRQHAGPGLMRDPKTVEAEWVLAAEREAALPGIRDEIAALRARGDLDTDDDAFVRAVRVLGDVRETDQRRAAAGEARDEEAARHVRPHATPASGDRAKSPAAGAPDTSFDNHEDAGHEDGE